MLAEGGHDAEGTAIDSDSVELDIGPPPGPPPPGPPPPAAAARAAAAGLPSGDVPEVPI